MYLRVKKDLKQKDRLQVIIMLEATKFRSGENTEYGLIWEGEVHDSIIWVGWLAYRSNRTWKSPCLKISFSIFAPSRTFAPPIL